MHQQINLLKAFAPPPKSVFPAEKMLTLFGLLLVGLAALYANAFWNKHKVEKEYEVLLMTQQNKASDLAQLSRQLPGSDALKGLQDEVGKLTQMVNAKTDFLKIVDRENNGFADYLQALSVHILSGVWLKEIIIDEENKNIALLGRTLSPDLVPLFLSGLKKEKVFSDVDFKQLQLAKPENKKLNMAFALRTLPDSKSIYIFPEDANLESKETGSDNTEKSLREKLVGAVFNNSEDKKPEGEKDETGFTGVIQKALGQ